MTPRLPIKTTAERLHAAYVAEMGYHPDDVPLTMSSHYAWQLFADKFSPDDLRQLIRYIRTKGRMARSLQARHLITGVNSIEFAHEDLAECRARMRNKPKPETPRQEILRSTGRPEKQPDNVTTPAEELKAMYAKLRMEAGL